MSAELAEALQACDHGEPAWPQISELLADGERSPARRRWALDHRADQCALWEASEEPVRQAILRCADQHLASHQPPEGDWLAQGQLPMGVIDGVRAIELLLTCDEAWAPGPGAELWAAWGPALLALPTRDEHAAALRLAGQRLAHAHAPAAMRAALLAEADGEHARHGRVWSLERFEWMWDLELEAELIERLRTVPLAAEAAGDLVAFGLARESAPLDAEGRALVRDGVGRRPMSVEGQIARQCAVALLKVAADGAWPVLRAAFASDHALARDVLRTVASMHGPALIDRVGATGLGELLRHAHRHHPPEQDPRSLDGQVTAPMIMSFWRGGLLQELIAAGTPESGVAIRWLADELGPSVITGRTLAQADEAVRRHRWDPPRARDMVALCLDRSRRLVRSDRDLHRVLLEQLDAIGEDLAGTAAVTELWANTKPKHEDECSSWLQRRLTERLRGRGVVVNREVEVYRHPGTGVGERTDLFVQAVTSGARDVVEVVIEVKGCWNRELMTAMDTQLVARYLQGEQPTCGIYLVLFFGRLGWEDDDDWRRPLCGRLEPGALLTELSAQAAAHTTALGRAVDARLLDASQR